MHGLLGEIALATHLRDLFALAILALILGNTGCNRRVNELAPGLQETPLEVSSSERDPSRLISTNLDELKARPDLEKVDELGDYPPIGIDPSSPSLQSELSNPFPRGKAPPILSVTLRTGKIDGLPIGLFSDKTLLMRTNGTIDFLDTSEIVSHRVTNQPFASQDLRTITADLQSEFGNSYRIRNASPYLVVAKPNQIGTWCERFNRFHHSIRLFCSTRGIPVRDLEFPLIAIVFASRKNFEQYAHLEGSEIPPNCVGYYSQRTNRIVLYEGEGANATESTLETICHEATHQFAFNTGLHQRLAATPLWLMEGFAVQFEAPAYCNYSVRDRTSYWPTAQRQAWGTLKQDRKRLGDLIQALVVSDSPFKSDTLNAYTAAWAMNNYLSQRRPKQYVEYLHRISSMKPFVDYSAGDRIRDFTAAFGSDLGILVRETILHTDRLR